MKWSFGAEPVRGGEANFRVWYPLGDRIDLRLLDSGITIPMEKDSRFMWSARAKVRDGERYLYRISGMDFPDPASRYQPEGVHGPSRIVDHSTYGWQSAGWSGLDLEDYVIYELHTGTFSTEGTYRGIIDKLDHLSDLGITAVELMPVSQFPGKRNWGYDGVFPYAPQNSYGAPDELKLLIDSIHSRGMCAVLDVVYNHLGPEGNWLPSFGPYFTDRYSTPWGKAVNYDGAYSDIVREFFIENALYWLSEYRFDSLRLDAIHGIYDFSPQHLLKEMKKKADHLASSEGRKICIIAESDLNDPVVVRDMEECGHGLSAQWSDDYHHALHAYVTGEKNGYYGDFGEFSQILKALESGYVYDGQYSSHRKRFHGAPFGSIPLNRLVVYSQDHDQVGNRAGAERLISLIGSRKAMAVASLVLLSPFTPLLFMGEEYGETSPFNYFIDTRDTNLAKAVKEGRNREFSSFGSPYGSDPNSSKEFLVSKLDWKKPEDRNGMQMQNFYRDNLGLRKKFELSGVNEFRASGPREGVVLMEYGGRRGITVLSSLNDDEIRTSAMVPDGAVILLGSWWKKYGGEGEDGSEIPENVEGPFVAVFSHR